MRGAVAPRQRVGSALAHAFGGLRRTPRVHPFFDPSPDIGVDVLPVLERPFEHLAWATDKLLRTIFLLALEFPPKTHASLHGDCGASGWRPGTPV